MQLRLKICVSIVKQENLMRKGLDFESIPCIISKIEGKESGWVMGCIYLSREEKGSVFLFGS